MVVVSYSGREINAKIVYYGPGLSGKTTNLEKIYDSVPETNRGRMVSMKTQTDRTLFFDLLPLDLGELSGMKTRFLLYTVPGQVYYNATRKLVLKGVDAIVFVADSSPDKMAENRESLINLEQNLKSYGLDLKTTPWVIQFNKRDLPNAMSIDQMNKELNRLNVPTFEAQAANGTGVFETLRGVSKLLLARISKDVVERDRGSMGAPARRAPAGAAPAPPAAAPETKSGKLMQALKRGRTADAPPPPPPAIEEPAFLDDDVLIEEAPPPPARETRATAAAAVIEPAPTAADEAMVLTDQDLIIEREQPRISRPHDDAGLLEGEIEREAYGSDVAEALPADGRTISVPIDLGALPKSGHVRLTFEIKVEVVDDAGAAGKRGRSRKAESVS